MPGKSENIKIQKALADFGLCSRRGAEKLIISGFIKVNGEVVTNPAIRINLDRDVIEYKGEKLVFEKTEPEGLILFKIPGYVTSKRDPNNRKTVYQLLPSSEQKKKWLYVGRLDRDTEGLLFFTNSGELVHRLTHPSFKIKKRYRVEVKGIPSNSRLKHLLRGVIIEGRLMRMDRVKIIAKEQEKAVLEVELHQGEKRQVKRMLAEIGHEVIALRRTVFGPLTLKGLKPGQTRRLDKAEIAALLKGISRRS